VANRWAGQISDTSSILSGPDALSRMDLIAIRIIAIGRSVTTQSVAVQYAIVGRVCFFIVQMQSPDAFSPSSTTCDAMTDQ